MGINTLVEKKGLGASASTWGWYHNFDTGVNALVDLSTSANDLVEQVTTPSSFMWNHEFITGSALFDSSVNANDLVEQVTFIDPTIGFTPIGNGSGANKYLFSTPTDQQLIFIYPNGILFNILYNFQITFEISPNADMSTALVFKVPIPSTPLYWSNQILDINGVAVHETVINNPAIGVVDAATKLIADANFLTSTYFTRWKIGSSNWSNIYTMGMLPVVF